MSSDSESSEFFEQDPFSAILNFRVDEVLQRNFEWKQKTRLFVTQDDVLSLRALVGTNYSSWFEQVHRDREVKMRTAKEHPEFEASYLGFLNQARFSPTRRVNKIRANFSALLSTKFSGVAYPHYLSDEAAYLIYLDSRAHSSSESFRNYMNDFAQWTMLITGRKYAYIILGPQNNPDPWFFREDVVDQQELMALATKFLKLTKGMRHVETHESSLSMTEAGILAPVAESTGLLKGPWVCPVCKKNCGGVCLYA